MSNFATKKKLFYCTFDRIGIVCFFSQSSFPNEKKNRYIYINKKDLNIVLFISYMERERREQERDVFLEKKKNKAANMVGKNNVF